MSLYLSGRRVISVGMSRFWQLLPLSRKAKTKLKDIVFGYFGFAFSWSTPYRQWQAPDLCTQYVLEQLDGQPRAHLILLVTHDCTATGAPFLLLALARELKACGFAVIVLALDSGELFSDFMRVGPTINMRGIDEIAAYDLLNGLKRIGLKYALTNTVVAGSVVGELKKRKFRVVSLIHELPGVIHILKQETNAQIIADLADKVVFPARMVCERFCKIARVPDAKIVIRPQGVLQANPYKRDTAAARALIGKKHHLADDASVILSIGNIDERKGYDLFLDIAISVINKWPKAVFIWIGTAQDPKIYNAITDRIRSHGLEKQILFPGFERDLSAYFAGASLFALTSREDPFPNVVLQSLEGGTPVIAFEGATGASDLIVEHQGMLAHAFDPQHFSDQVLAFLRDPARVEGEGAGSMHQYVTDLLAQLTAAPHA